MGEQFRANASAMFVVNADSPTKRTLSGRDFVSYPATLLAARADLNGEKISQEELSWHYAAWNGTIVLAGNDHPRDDASFPLSANTPEIWEESAIGYVFSSSISKDGGELQAELWVDIGKAKSIPDGQRFLSAMAVGGTLPVSTGYWCDIRRVNGTNWQENLKPDHVLAILQGDGACSLEDGCGVRGQSAQPGLQTNKKRSKTMNIDIKALAEKLGVEPGALDGVSDEVIAAVDAVVNEDCDDGDGDGDNAGCDCATTDSADGADVVATNATNAFDVDAVITAAIDKALSAPAIADALGFVAGQREALSAYIAANSDYEQGDLQVKSIAYWQVMAKRYGMSDYSGLAPIEDNSDGDGEPRVQIPMPSLL